MSRTPALRVRWEPFELSAAAGVFAAAAVYTAELVAAAIRTSFHAGRDSIVRLVGRIVATGTEGDLYVVIILLAAIAFAWCETVRWYPDAAATPHDRAVPATEAAGTHRRRLGLIAVALGTMLVLAAGAGVARMAAVCFHVIFGAGVLGAAGYYVGEAGRLAFMLVIATGGMLVVVRMLRQCGWFAEPSSQ